jgi:hypothetical protein
MTSLTCCGRIMYQSMKHKSTTFQEDVMNKKQMVMAALMLAAGTSLSQAQTFYPVLKNYSAADKERMDKSFANSLSFTNNGLVASALVIVTMIKLDLPEDEFPLIRDKINYLAAHGATPLIRYRACLAGAVFDNPELYKEAAERQSSDPSAFFSALDHRTSDSILSSQ